ncbi:response regulator [Thermoleptolyngbya sp. M55_K2018_002]|uniref:response regulator n=1 Tax=Thermoleptolyngbya sp. M55_K2018_002 TaxID=2747808 RepID=UPI0019DEA603|nr:response regulator transcription factor [Thermoleptolyngbya sp. M55_K2018_002]
MMTKPLRLLLVEDDELFRLGLQVRLRQEAGIEIAAEAEDGETAIALAQQHPLDVVLLDIGLPGLGGLETCRQLKQVAPTLPILVLTSQSQKTLIPQIIEAGAQGYCLKGIGAETLVLALRSVAAGASWWDAAATAEIRTALDLRAAPSAAVQSGAASAPPLPSTVGLTQRELEILSLMSKGKNNQEIAATLYITPGTVRVHVHSILQKLEVRDRTQAVLAAIQQHLV